jgi:hypothetical protein
MPLRDHFHPPVLDKHTWDEVHGLWPAMIVRDLFDLLPPGFQAAPNIHLGSPYEVDVSTFEHDTREPGSELGDAGVAAASAPAPTLTLEADFSDLDEYEVRIYDADRGRHLVAAIEIVSPSNKDRPETREAFVGKVATLLQKDVCVSIVDRRPRLDRTGELVRRAVGPPRPERPAPGPDPTADVRGHAPHPQAGETADPRRYLVLPDDRRPTAPDNPALVDPRPPHSAPARVRLSGNVPVVADPVTGYSSAAMPRNNPT